MKKLTSFLLVVILALTMTSCADMMAKRQISKLESLVERVEQKGADYTNQQWSDVSAEYDRICDKMAQYKYTDEQLQEIGRLKGRYYAARVKNAGGLFNGLFQQMSGVVDGILDGVGNVVDGFLDGVLSDDQPTTNDQRPATNDQQDDMLQELEEMFE